MHTPRDDKAGGHICKFNADAAPSSLRLGFTAVLDHGMHILAGPLAPALSPTPPHSHHAHVHLHHKDRQTPTATMTATTAVATAALAATRPLRIASFLPAATEMLFSLGLGDLVCGITHECDYPPEVSVLFLFVPFSLFLFSLAILLTPRPSTILTPKKTGQAKTRRRRMCP